MENRDLIKNAVKYINNLGANTTTLDDVAKNAGFSTDYFNRIFRNYTGFNVMEYVKFRKLNRAARMLRPPTTEISYRLPLIRDMKATKDLHVHSKNNTARRAVNTGKT